MKHLLLLHGALGSDELFKPLKEELTDSFTIHSLNFSGHGGNAFSKKGFGIEVFSEELNDYLTKNKIRNCSVFAYSMGGYIALYLESRQSGSFSKILTLGTKFNWTPENAERESKMLNPDQIAIKVPKFANILQQRHGEDWRELLIKTSEMMVRLGDRPLLNAQVLNKITTPVIISRGSDDNMVSIEESQTATHNLAQAQFIELSSTPHPLEKCDLKVLAEAIKAHL